MYSCMSSNQFCATEPSIQRLLVCLWMNDDGRRKVSSVLCLWIWEIEWFLYSCYFSYLSKVQFLSALGHNDKCKGKTENDARFQYSSMKMTMQYERTIKALIKLQNPHKYEKIILHSLFYLKYKIIWFAWKSNRHFLCAEFSLFS